MRFLGVHYIGTNGNIGAYVSNKSQNCVNTYIPNEK